MNTKNRNLLIGATAVLISTSSLAFGNVVMASRGVSVGAVASVANPKFTDVKGNEWFSKGVTEMVNKGIVKGYQEDNGTFTFRPNQKVTLAEFLMMSIPNSENKKSTDYPSLGEGQHWASGVYKKAVDLDVINPNDVDFKADKLNQPINRENMAFIMINLNEKVRGEEAIKDTSKTDSKITDIGTIKAERQYAVKQSFAKGLLTGKGNGMFSGADTTTRAEAVSVLLRESKKEERVDPNKEIETPQGTGRIIKWNDANKPLNPKVGDTIITKDGRTIIIKEAYGVIGGNQNFDYHEGTVINGINFKDKNTGAIGMQDTTNGRDLAGQPYWVANGEGHFDSEWTRMADRVKAEFNSELQDKGIDVTQLEEGKVYHNGWIMIKGGTVNFTGGQAGFNANNYQQGKY